MGKTVVRKKGEKGDARIIIAFAIIGLCMLMLIGSVFLAPLWDVQTPITAEINKYILHDVEGIKIDGVLEIRHVSVSDDALMVIKDMVDNETDPIKKDALEQQYNAMVLTKDMILVRFVFTDGSGRCNPADCGFIVYYPSMTTDEYDCGEPATARINAVTLKPTIPAMEAGTKTQILYFDNIRMIGSKNCEVGPPFRFDDEKQNHNFLTDILGQANDIISNIPRCTLGVYSGGNYTESDCFAAQYYTQETLIGIGPVPNRGQASIFFVASTNTELSLYNVNDLFVMANSDPTTATMLNNVALIMQDTPVLTEDSLNGIEALLRSAENYIQFDN